MIKQHHALVLLLIMIFSAPVWAAESGSPSDVEELKAMLDQIGKGEKNELLIEAYLNNRSQLADKDWGFWSGFHQSDLNDDRPGNAKESDSTIYSVGLDYRYSPRLLVGAALIAQDTDVISDPSATALAGFSTVDVDGGGVSLYGMYTLNSGIGVDANFSYMSVDSTTTDFSALAAPSSKSTGGNNYAIGIGASLIYPFSGQFWASGRVGYSHAWGDQDEHIDAFARFQDEQDYEIGTFNFKTNLNYRFNRFITPYAGINLGYDVTSDIANPALVLNPGGGVATAVPFQSERENFSYGFQAGVKVNISQFASLSGGYQQQNWGSNLDVDSYALNLRILF